MRTRVSLVGLAVVCAFALAVSVAGEGDYHSCAVCKPMMEEPGLMQHVRWDSQKIATGMISVTSVNAEYAEAFDRAFDKMLQSAKRLEKGEKLELCPMCARMSALAEAGATIEHVNAGGTRITAVTASQPEVIDKIHAHLAWAEKEFGASDHSHGG